MNEVFRLINKLEKDRQLTRDEWIMIFETDPAVLQEPLAERARRISIGNFGHEIFTRGLIEFTSYCRNDCYYCGIRRSNKELPRYRLDREQILECCDRGYELGFRTFVLQGGEDPCIDDEEMVSVISAIHDGFGDCAITLSIGERSHDSYLRYFEAGAERYLLRHETADPWNYARLHPGELSLQRRMDCLWDLKRIGYQVGTGFMVGSPGQNAETLAEDMLFIEKLAPHMIGIGPFVPHHATPFADKKAGTAEQTLVCISLLRLMLPQALIPATTALGTIEADGRERGILAGANVVMPNLSPLSYRKKYELYDHKICTGEEAAECRDCLELRMEAIGYTLAVSRGDHPLMKKGKGNNNV